MAGRRKTARRKTPPRRGAPSRIPFGVLPRRPPKTWDRPPSPQPDPIGYLLRGARRKAELTQLALARRLGCSQQAVAQAERWESNPTVEHLRRWARACGADVTIRMD
jgi:DNA-binding XRE family transcriptional regulator